jgi:hypothetical protein
MKKIITVIAVLFSFSTIAQKKDSVEKVYEVKLNESQIQMFYKTLEVSKQAIQQSTIPMNTGLETIKEVDSLQAVIRKVYIDKNKK